MWAALLTHLSLASAALPATVYPTAADWTQLWWAHGWPVSDPATPRLRCLRTGRYGCVLDTARLTVPHCGALPTSAAYQAADRLPPADLFALPPAPLELTLTVDGSTWRCTGAAPASQHGGPRIIESGRYLQRSDITDLRFSAADGRTLAVEARLEQIAWPDRLTWLLEARPTTAPTVGGPGFGRVGGGYGCDRQTVLDLPANPGLEAPQVSAELWVYPTAEPPLTQLYPWLLCKNANEWAAGSYGLALVGGRATAFLNTSSGREGCRQVSGPGLTPEQWHHLALTWDGAVLRLYVDGRPGGEVAAPGPRQAVPGPLAVGRRLDGSGDGYRFRGQVDELRVWSRALTADEVAAHHRQPEQVGGAGLVLAETFDAAGPTLLQRPSTVWAQASARVAFAGEQATVDGTASRTSPLRCAVTWRAPGAAAEQVHVSAAELSGAARPVSWDPLLGAQRIDLAGVVPQGQGNDLLERVQLRLRNPGPTPAVARLWFDKAGGAAFRTPGLQAITGLTPLLRQADGRLTGLPLQISKNWHSQPDQEIPHQGLWLHAISLLRLPPGADLELELAIAYAHWGGLPAASHAQLCLIGWGSNQLWDQSALGSWGESICYEPDQAQADATVLDVRPVLVHAMGRPTPVRNNWTNNVGGADFFRGFDPAGRRWRPAAMRTTYHRVGPCLTEVTYAGESADGALRHRATVMLARSDDLVRGTYHLRLEVTARLPFARFVIAQVGADSYSYTGERQMAVGNATGLLREWATQWGGGAYRTAPLELSGRAPWISMHQAVRRDASAAGAWANRGLVVRDWQARLGGQPAAPWMAEYGVRARGSDTSTADLLPPPTVHELLPGDFVECTLVHLVVPQFARDYYGPNAGLRAALEAGQDTWRPVWREAAGNDLELRAVSGTVLRHWPPRIAAAAGGAEVTVTGGLGYVPLTVTGLASPQAVWEVRPGEAWQRVDQAVHGDDFQQADYQPADGTWEVTANLPLDAPGDRRRTVAVRLRAGAETE
ncbi:MAG: LamG domain-containing protein [Fimbriimonadaceae bacterium]|nr:LamG domain-containing protein [Fimbriimonadaceae bacterium]